MQIEVLKIHRFGCWEELTLEGFSKYNVFIGENSSGKSTIFEAIIRNLLQSHIPKERITHYRSSSRIVTRFKYNKEEINELLVEWNDSHDLNQDFFKRVVQSSEFLELSLEKTIEVKPGGSTSQELTYRRLNEVIGVQQYISKCVRNIDSSYKQYKNTLPFLENKIITHCNKKLVQIPSKRRISGEKTSDSYGYSYGFDGSNLKRMLHDAKNSTNKKRKDGFLKFQNIVSNWSFSPGRPDIEAKAGDAINLIFWKDEETTIKVEEVGDGVKEAVIIAGVCLTYPENIFLIEEPELHLHPRALRELRDLLKHEITGQVFISTHNPVFINEIDNETTIIKILKKGDSLKPIPITNRAELRDFKHQFGLMNSDFLFEDSLVFVEGFSDCITFESWFEILFPFNHSVKFIAVGGEDEIKPALVLSMMLQLQQSFSLFSILDSDKITPEEKKDEIMKNLNGRMPQLFDQFAEDTIKENIYVLERRKLEDYFLLVPRILSKWLEIKQEDLEEYLSKIKGSSDRKLRLLAKKYGISFKKTRDLPKLASMMEECEIDPEIRRLLNRIQLISS